MWCISGFILRLSHPSNWLFSHTFLFAVSPRKWRTDSRRLMPCKAIRVVMCTSSSNTTHPPNKLSISTKSARRSRWCMLVTRMSRRPSTRRAPFGMVGMFSKGQGHKMRKFFFTSFLSPYLQSENITKKYPKIL